MLCNGSGDGISAPPRPPPLARRPVSAVAPPPMPGQSRLQCPGCWHWKHTSWLRYAGSGLRSGGLPAPAAKTPLSRRPPSAAGLPPSTPGQSRVQCPGCRHLKHTSWLRYAGGVLGSGGLPAPAAKTPLSRSAAPHPRAVPTPVPRLLAFEAGVLAAVPRRGLRRASSYMCGLRRAAAGLCLVQRPGARFESS